MRDPQAERILAFLEGEMADEARSAFLDEVEADPELARDLGLAARGVEAVQALDPIRSVHDSPEAGSDSERGTDDRSSTVHGPAGRGKRGNRPRLVSPWWIGVASVATLVLAVPTTLWWSGFRPEATRGVTAPSGQPLSPDPSFVLILHGTWPDASALDQVETSRRAAEYWSWTSALAESQRLVAAGDLRWEVGERLGPEGPVSPSAALPVGSPDFVVGMFAVRVDSYSEALALARDCPHLRYGGSVSVRRVAGGFVTPGIGDWGG